MSKKINYYKSLGKIYGHYTRNDVKDYFSKILMFNKEEMLKCLEIITDYQTDEELSKGLSIEENNFGWSKIDAYRMPRLLKIYKNSKKFKNGPKSVGLTKDHWDLLRKILPNYWNQYALSVDFREYLPKMKEYFGD